MRTVCALILLVYCLHSCAEFVPRAYDHETAVALQVLYELEDAVSVPEVDCQWGELIDCRHGSWICNGSTFGYCLCDPGWTGINCSMCETDSVCMHKGSEFICDRSINAYTNKEYTCNITDPTIQHLMMGGFVQFTCHFHQQFPNCSVIIWYTTHGPPSLLSCDLIDCISEPGDIQSTVTCGHAQCRCSTEPVQPCNDALIELAEQIHGGSLLQCDVASNNCTFTQYELQVALPLHCEASACTIPPPPPPRQLTAAQLAGILSGASLGFFAVFFTVVKVSLVFYNRSMSRPMHDMLKEERAKLRTVRQQLVVHSSDEEDPPRPFTPTSTTEPAMPEKASTPDPDAISLVFRRVMYTLPPKRTLCGKSAPGQEILHGVSGMARSGSMLAILGASGAGKSTLLDILAGRNKVGTVSGEILVNGVERDLATFQTMCGYVMQDEALMATLTVQETLLFAAEMRLPTTFTRLQRLQRVQSVMSELGLSHIAHSRIGNTTVRGISGGERRRVAIATELITQPSVLFLDEPTTGLDAYNALSVMRMLKRLAEQGRNIVFSIHQPRSNIFQLFDDMILLADGNVVYRGPAPQVAAYFRSVGFPCPTGYNPADFVIDLLSKEERQAGVVEQLTRAYEVLDDVDVASATVAAAQMQKPIAALLPLTSGERVHHAMMRFRALSKRTFINTVRNPFLMLGQYALALTVALTIGIVYFHLQSNFVGVQNRFGAIFFITALFGLSSMTCIELFIDERLIFLRERASKYYGTVNYFMAKIMFELLPMRALPPMLLGTISYWMMGFQSDSEKFMIFLLVLMLVNLSATSFCMSISALAPTVAVGNLFGVIGLLFFLMFGGFLVSNDHLPVYLSWIRYVSFFNYAVEALATNELAGVVIIFDPQGATPLPLNGNEILRNFGFDPMMFTRDMICLSVFTPLFLIVTALALRFVRRDTQ